MGPLFLIVCVSLASLGVEAQEIKSARLLDLLIRDYTFKSLDIRLKTGTLHTVNLPSNFSGITVDAGKFRCGSLHRYGAQIKEFHLGTGVIIQPCVERLMVIRQNLGFNWSAIYYANYDLSGYQLVSPILGLLAYNVANDANLSDPFELGIHSEEQTITVDFKNAARLIPNISGTRPLCASFENDGRVTLRDLVSNNSHVCEATRQCHYGLVVKVSLPPPPTNPSDQMEKKISLWKVVVGSTIGSALGAFLLVLLLVAMFSKVKKKARMVEMERRAYEEEALQVTMVGHVIKIPTAAVTRTLPTIETNHAPHPS